MWRSASACRAPSTPSWRSWRRCAPAAPSCRWTLDEAGQPVPAGQVGEICIGGANVGRGYRQRPSLTADRFVTQPESGERLYRTGDLGSWTPEGDIAFHGRRDEQVKVLRGHRLEQDEISAALARHPTVRQSAVVAQGDGPERRLVAYIVPKDATAPRGPELRDFLSVTLPAYMLPEAFVRIAALPLTANSKLDRPALPLPTAANMLPGARYRAPASPVERGIAAVTAAFEPVPGLHLAVAASSPSSAAWRLVISQRPNSASNRPGLFTRNP